LKIGEQTTGLDLAIQFNHCAALQTNNAAGFKTEQHIGNLNTHMKRL